MLSSIIMPEKAWLQLCLLPEGDGTLQEVFLFFSFSLLVCLCLCVIFAIVTNTVRFDMDI